MFFHFLGNGFFFDQGDMIIDCELYEELHPGKSCKGGQSRKKRNAIRARKRLWTSRKIPYKIPYYMSKYPSTSYSQSLSQIRSQIEVKHTTHDPYKFKTQVNEAVMSVKPEKPK